MKVSNVASIVNQKIDGCLLDKHTYISTECMLPNCGGIEDSSSIPNGKATRFCVDDILLSNIRPYFKKVWFANFEGGCSNDVICLRATSLKCSSKYLYYAICTDKFIDTFSASSKGTKMPRGDKNALLSYEIPDRSIDEQLYIVDILGSIDEKIENNQKKARELENFLTLQYQDLVARDTIDCPLSKYITVLTGKLDANAENPTGEYPFFTCSIIPERIDNYAFDCRAIIIAGNGNFNVRYYQGKFNAYQRTYVITAEKHFAEILQHYKTKVQEWTNSARGSVIKFLTKSMLTDDTFKVSNNDNMNDKYERISDAVYEKTKNMLEENLKLNELKQLYLKKFFG